uniref:Uncharacterized protein n=1 Tax=Salix viminalis TaxID=40686 RepID=A0A6N2MQN9_SALVM
MLLCCGNLIYMHLLSFFMLFHNPELGCGITIAESRDGFCLSSSGESKVVFSHFCNETQSYHMICDLCEEFSWGKTFYVLHFLCTFIFLILRDIHC